MIYMLVAQAPPAFSLPRSVRALRGWRRLDPGHMRLPMPWALAALVISGMAPMNVKAALAALTMFVGYLRPVEAFRVRRQDLLAPMRPGGHHALLIHPADTDMVSKTGISNESVLLDACFAPWLGRMLTQVQAAHREDFLFGLTYGRFKT
eukprot:6486355-Amphidinium_carterae.1